MKTLLTRLVLLTATLIPLAQSNAQITITQSDIGRIFGPGNQLINRTDMVTTSMNIGAPGFNNWDFTGIATSKFQVFTSVAAASTPWIGNFPGATNAMKVDTNYQGINGTVYQYLQLNTTGLRNMGNMARANPYPGVTVELRTSVNPMEVVYAVPLALNTTWNTAFRNITLITVNGQPAADPDTNTHDATYTVDGYGTMRLPGSTQALYAMRIRKLNYYNGGPVVSFIFISRGGAQVACEATDTSARNGVINVRLNTVVWNTSMTTDSTTDVRVSEAIPTSFALKQNYPNPFNPVTTINYQLAIDNSQLTILKVYDLLGREVATLVNEEKPAGTYQVEFDAGNLPSGVYYYRLTAGPFTQTRKMILAK